MANWYWREYYAINRRVWPTWGRIPAAWDAFKMAVKVRRLPEHSDGREVDDGQS